MIHNVRQRVKFLDVGHGDSAVIYLMDEQLKKEKVIVVDIADSDKLLAELKSNKVKEIELIIISHSDADHCRGVNDFLEKFMLIGCIKKICFNIDKNLPTNTMKLFLKKFVEICNRRLSLVSGTIKDTSLLREELLAFEGSKLFLLYPNMAEETEAYLQKSTNNASIVCLLENEVCSMLFSGDLEEKGWERMLKRLPGLRCDILKMPHHGVFYSGKKKLD